MSTKTRKQTAGSDDDAPAAFVQKAEIDATLARLRALSGDHFGYAPDDVTRAHVGSLEHHADLPRRITAMAFREGEHAA
ncbi:MAG TPA: hypothetical protein VFG43_14555 [Geminicoccaceae bacterium]|nr:hypothetical protein [Geminicoccaceae bacterium]